MPQSRVALAGTEHAALPDARVVGPVDPHQLMEVSLIVRHRNPLPALTGREKPMDHDQFAKNYGADPAHLQRVREFAAANGLHMIERGDETLRRTVCLTGTAAAMEKAFGVELSAYEHPHGSYRSHAGPVRIPQELAEVVTGVLGLDSRPMVQPRIRFPQGERIVRAHAAGVSFNPNDVAKLYQFPENATGEGQTIALLEFGGGFRPADIQQYFANLGLTAPTVTAVSVDQAQNVPSTPQGADSEVMLDIEVAGAVAPRAAIAVYFAPNSARGFYDALSTAVHDQTRKPSVISISWGGPESSWSEQSMQNFDSVAQEAGLLGVSITAASGDSGSSDGVNDGEAHVDFPASAPHVMGVGGTKLTAANGRIGEEQVWNDGTQGGASGGGYSTVFPKPDWQTANAGNADRGVPDLAANSDPETGYNVLVDGEQMVVGGTSAAAPLCAGLIALLNQSLGRNLGFANPTFYAADAQNCFHDITVGNNGAYAAAAGWDACTGLGSPIGSALLAALQADAAPATPGRQPDAAA